MKSSIESLFGRYIQHHTRNTHVFEWAGFIGLVAFPCFYLLRFTGKIPLRYDDVELRGAATLLCLFAALRRWWPARLKPFYLPYSYFTVVYCLSFLLTFTALKNQFETFSVVNLLVGTGLIILLADWRNAVAILIMGYSAALVSFRLLEPSAHISSDVVIWMPACALVVVTGAMAYFAQKQAELRRMRNLYTGLAGSIAHEMRSPFMQLGCAVELLARNLAVGPVEGKVTFTREQISDMLEILGGSQNAVQHGLQSIDITLAQLKPKAFDVSSFQHVGAARCVKQAVDAFAYESDAERRRVQVRVACDFVFDGDETMLTMIIFNLLKNAIFYFPLRPQATITITVGDEYPGRITVRDTGPGIAPDALANLFADFESAGKKEGTGLGLSFCRRMMQAFGGHITCRSTEGEFTEFMLDFPEVPPGDVHAAQEKLLEHARVLLVNKQVLVVDDDPVVSHLTVSKLTAMGCTAHEARDGMQALEMLGKSHYDLVVTDINMPQLDGYELARRIRQGMAGGRTGLPVIGHSTKSSNADAERARKAGMNAFVGKPCAAHELAIAVAQAFQSVPQAGASAASRLAGKTVLLADDSRLNRSIVKSYLVELDLQVIEASHGAEVMQVLNAGARPHVILMDMHMPGMDGVAATRALRKLPAPCGNIPVVALTGNSTQERRDEARDAGMNGFLVKPVGVEVLKRELSRVLEARWNGRNASLARHSEDAPQLLDVERMAGVIRAGLMPQVITQIDGFFASIDRAMETRDRIGVMEALHSALGLTGEAGAQALHAAARSPYRELEEGRWPRQPDWLVQLRQLWISTKDALREHQKAPLQARS